MTTGDLADGRSRRDESLNRSARGHVDCRGAHVEAGIGQSFCRRIGVFLAQVGQQTCLPALTRRAIAWPIDPAPMTTITFFIGRLSTPLIPARPHSDQLPVRTDHHFDRLPQQRRDGGPPELPTGAENLPDELVAGERAVRFRRVKERDTAVVTGGDLADTNGLSVAAVPGIV